MANPKVSHAIYPRCTWRTCRAPGPWTITAGTPGSGNYAQAGACDQHRPHVERRTKRYANGESAVVKMFPNFDEKFAKTFAKPGDSAPQLTLELEGK